MAKNTNSLNITVLFFSHDPDTFRKKQKIARYLISKGFEGELVFGVLNEKN